METKFIVGQTVFVDFEASNRTDADGKLFSGHGVIDRLEDGYCFGKTDDGRPFCCPVAFVFPPKAGYKTPSDLDQFKAYIKSSDDHQSLINVHGERLFSRENGVYRVLSIRLAYQIWRQQRVKPLVTPDDLAKFNFILGLFFAGLAVNYCHSFGVTNVYEFSINSLVIAMGLWLLLSFIQDIMSKRSND